MLGSEIARQLENTNIPFVGTDREVDITNRQELEAFAASNLGITWVVNCAAYTAVEKAETEPELAEKLNATGAGNIAAVAHSLGAGIIHISTDYVFDGTGKTPYTEIMPMAPLGVYGKTKAQGEELVLKAHPDAYIFRTAWLYGPRGKNFVYTMVNLMNSRDSISVVNDQFGTPTCTLDLARYIILTILGNQDLPGNPHPKIMSGIYHCTGEGETTWFSFAQEIYAIGREKGCCCQCVQIVGSVKADASVVGAYKTAIITQHPEYLVGSYVATFVYVAIGGVQSHQRVVTIELHAFPVAPRHGIHINKVAMYNACHHKCRLNITVIALLPVVGDAAILL